MIGSLFSYFSAVPDWAVALGVVAVVIAAALVAHRILFGLLRRFWVWKHPIANALAERARGISRYALVLFALSAVIPAMPLNPRAMDIVHKIFVAAVVLLIGWVALLAVRIVADHYMGRFQNDTTDNLLARKAATQVSMLTRVVEILIIMMTCGAALMTFDTVREFGVSLFASAGIAGLVAGLAARPIFANIFAGIQLALTQPIRLNDAVLVENEFGWVEELGSSYVVIRLWDLRRLVVPLSYFMERPFQNWTRTSSHLLGAVILHTDFSVPVARLREKAIEIAKASKVWDRRVVNLQVVDMTENSMQLRVLVSAANAGNLWDLRVEMREKLILFLQEEFPTALPRRRNEVMNPDAIASDGPRPADGEDKPRPAH